MMQRRRALSTGSVLSFASVAWRQWDKIKQRKRARTSRGKDRIGRHHELEQEEKDRGPGSWKCYTRGVHRSYSERIGGALSSPTQRRCFAFCICFRFATRLVSLLENGVCPEKVRPRSSHHVRGPRHHGFLNKCAVDPLVWLEIR